MAQVRNGRIRPGLDDKILASWNGLLLKGLVDTYRALGDETIRDTAVRLGEFLRDKMAGKNGLWHSHKAGRSTIPGFLEDYAAVGEGLVGLYQITFDESWLHLAERLLDEAITKFHDPSDGFFFFTDAQAETLIARKKELLDNVIPGSNSILAHALYQAGTLLDRADFLDKAETMLSKITRLLGTEIQVVTNWAALYANHATPTAEIVIVGPESDALRKDFDRFFVPNRVMAGAEVGSDLPLLEGRTALDGKTAIYVCFDKTCQLPVHSVEEALGMIESI